MPTNLPPEYYEVEKRYKAAESVQEKITCLEEMLSAIPKHKGTDKLRADYRRRLSKLKSSAQSKKKTGGYQSAFQIDREGAGQVVVIGPTNVCNIECTVRDSSQCVGSWRCFADDFVYLFVRQLIRSLQAGCRHVATSFFAPYKYNTQFQNIAKAFWCQAVLQKR